MKTKTDKQAIGGAGERKAAALLTMAVCAQTSHGTMEEDGGKVDLKISFRSFIKPASVITAHCQVKSGESFHADSSTKELLKLSIDSQTLDALADGSQPAFVAWVSPKPHGRVYWKDINPRRRHRTVLKIPESQFVTPSLRVDLSRIHAFRSRHPGRSVINLPPNGDKTLAQAKNHYKALKVHEVISPMIGEIHFTRKGWRHITRQSRDTKKIKRSFELLPYLRTLLSTCPDRYLLVRNKSERISIYTRETREVVLWFLGAIKGDDGLYDVLVRLDEQIVYPTKWFRDGLAPSQIKVSTTVKRALRQMRMMDSC